MMTDDAGLVVLLQYYQVSKNYSEPRVVTLTHRLGSQSCGRTGLETKGEVIESQLLPERELQLERREERRTGWRI